MRGWLKLALRESEFRVAGEAASAEETASELGISDQTVKTLVARSCAKLGVRRRSDAAAAARGLGLLLL